jgi:hypothetical protein
MYSNLVIGSTAANDNAQGLCERSALKGLESQVLAAQLVAASAAHMVGAAARSLIVLLQNYSDWTNPRWTQD